MRQVRPQVRQVSPHSPGKAPGEAGKPALRQQLPQSLLQHMTHAQFCHRAPQNSPWIWRSSYKNEMTFQDFSGPGTLSALHMYPHFSISTSLSPVVPILWTKNREQPQCRAGNVLDSMEPPLMATRGPVALGVP